MSGANFSLFLLAAVVIAIVPGPGIFYVTARTLAGGRRAGVTSTFGTAVGGLVHVVAGGFGVSAIILASAQLFTALKLAGALYLIWLASEPSAKRASCRRNRSAPAEPGGRFGKALRSRRSIRRPRRSFWRSFRNFWTRWLGTRRGSS